MSKKDVYRLESLKRLMLYILGRRPDEFGLLPDKDGFIKKKELIQVLHEEGFGFAREGHINEIMMHDGRDLFELTEDNKRIRAKEIEWDVELQNSVLNVPKILYTCVRRRAYPFVLEKGLFSFDESYIILSESEEMAIRIGSRRDQKPVLLEIRAQEAIDHGSIFFRFGILYLSKWIPNQFISGPPMEEEYKSKKKEKEREKKDKVKEAFEAGTFHLKPEKKEKGKKGRKKKGWKEEVRKARKKKYLDFF